MIAVMLWMLVFGVVHSLSAGQVKGWFRARFGERAYHGLYRLFYNGLSVVMLIPAALLVVFHDTGIVWQVDLVWEPVLLAAQGVGLVGMIVSLMQIDLLQFAGVSQAWAYVRGDPLPLPSEPLQTGGVYALVRHPLYLFSLLILWPVTTMTGAYLGFCVGATTYFIVGSWWEERRLLATFGESYAVYQRRVPRLLPFPRPRRAAQ